jgi:hypothetical protein
MIINEVIYKEEKIMMKSDIDLAKEILVNEKLNICIVKNGKIVFKSTRRGIHPMYIAVTEHFEELENASVADRIIGRAAAMLDSYAKIRAVYSEVISENAVEMLEANNISISYETKVENIRNRDKTDLCPIEKLSSTIKDNEVNILIEKIRVFLISISAI